MEKRKFEIAMTVPIGVKYGTLSFEEDSGRINGILDILHHQNTIIGNISAEGSLYFIGEIVTLVRTFPYEARGTISGGKLSAEIKGERISYTLSGREVSL